MSSTTSSIIRSAILHHFQAQIPHLTIHQSLNLLSPFILCSDYHLLVHQIILNEDLEDDYWESYFNVLYQNLNNENFWLITSIIDVLQKTCFSFSKSDKILCKVSFWVKSKKFNPTKEKLKEQLKRKQDEIEGISKNLSTELIKIFLNFLIGFISGDFSQEKILNKLKEVEEDLSWRTCKMKFILLLCCKHFSEQNLHKLVNFARKYLCVQDDIHGLYGLREKQSLPCSKCMENKKKNNNLLNLSQVQFWQTFSLQKQSVRQIIQLSQQSLSIKHYHDYQSIRKLKPTIISVLSKEVPINFIQQYFYLVNKICPLLMSFQDEHLLMTKIIKNLNKSIVLISSKYREQIMQIVIGIMLFLKKEKDRQAYGHCISIIKKCIQSEEDLKMLVGILGVIQKKAQKTQIRRIICDLSGFGKGIQQYLSHETRSLCV